MADNLEEKRRRNRARAKANRHVKWGELWPRPCEICGNAKAEMHHPDYAKPLEVVWLCRIHHKAQHRKLTAKQIEAIHDLRKQGVTLQAIADWIGCTGPAVLYVLKHGRERPSNRGHS